MKAKHEIMIAGLGCSDVIPLALVDQIDEANTYNDRKRSYIRVRQSRSSSDDIRLIFYYIISTGNNKVAQLLRSFNFFGVVSDTLILAGDEELFGKLTTGQFKLDRPRCRLMLPVIFPPR